MSAEALWSVMLSYFCIGLNFWFCLLFALVLLALVLDIKEVWIVMALVRFVEEVEEDEEEPEVVLPLPA